MSRNRIFVEKTSSNEIIKMDPNPMWLISLEKEEIWIHLNTDVYRECISCLFCSYDKIPEEKQLKRWKVYFGSRFSPWLACSTAFGPVVRQHILVSSVWQRWQSGSRGGERQRERGKIQNKTYPSMAPLLPPPPPTSSSQAPAPKKVHLAVKLSMD
jgi:hypothetical protein